jgi:hypothetical protein
MLDKMVTLSQILDIFEIWKILSVDERDKNRITFTKELREQLA